ncbi:hypothetical protein ACP275_09G005300 [Erythranthe tilingii]
MNHDKKKKKKKNDNGEEQQFEFCEVCKLNHNQGRRHIYFPAHKSSLSALLTRLQSKLSTVKSFLKTPMLLPAEHAQQNRLWCVFCNCDVIELDTPFACGKAIEHLASGEHYKRVKGFLWKHGGGTHRADSFRVVEGDFKKWEKKCKSMNTEAAKAEAVGASNNIHNELNADYLNSFHENNMNSLDFNITNGVVVPLQSYTNEKVQVSCSVPYSASEAGSTLYDMRGRMQMVDAQCLKNSTGFMDNHHSSSSHVGYLSNGSQVQPGVKVVHGESRSLNSMNLQKVSYSSKEAIGGNVHTGATPPWFNSAEENEIMQKPELSNFVNSKAEKSSKLNPKRVGAAWAERRKFELELERRGEVITKDYDADWLPNFGGVWQSGTRRKSRKEFQVENKKSLEFDSQSESSVPLQPYISKRMRRDNSER